MIYNNRQFIYKISINIKDLNSVNNIEDILYSKLNILENKCFEYGYVKENSIKILKKTQGYLNPIIFVPFIEYKLLCSADIFKPNINDIYLVQVLSINKIAIMCCIKYTYNNKTIMPIRIIIAKHTQNTELINNIKKGDGIYIKIIGYKFTKKSNNIDSIANIISEEEINNIKSLKIIINKLNTIEHNCKIDVDKINIYTNILKFILDKTTITYNELFIYYFIIQKKITIHTMDFVDTYNFYIENFDKKDNIIQNISIINDDDLINNETNPDDETYPDDEINLDEDNQESYDYNYIEDNHKNKKNNIYVGEINDEDDEEDEEENEDEEEENEDEEDNNDIDNIEKTNLIK